MRPIAVALTTLLFAGIALAPIAADAGKRKDKSEVERVAMAIQGEWHVRPPRSEPLMAAMRLIVRDPPPTESELDALGLSAEHVAKLKAAALPEPTDSLREAARSTLEKADQVRIVVTVDRLSLRSPGTEAEEIAYTIMGGSTDRVRMQLTRASGGMEEGLWVLVDGDVHVLEDGEKRFTLERVQEVTP